MNAILRYTRDGALAECPCCASLEVGGAHNTVHYYSCYLSISRTGPLQNAIDAWNRRPAIAPPVAAGSVDTVGFRIVLAVLEASFDDDCMPDDCVLAHDNFIAHIDAWGAQQRHEGFQEGVAQLQQERDNLLKLAASRREWAEKAEARVKELEAEVVDLKFEIAHPGDAA